MKRQIRRGVFETNSSSVHSLTMCSREEYDKWLDGELVYDTWSYKLIDANTPDEHNEYLTYDEFNDMEYDVFVRHYTTDHGDEVVAFGFYGYS